MGFQTKWRVLAFFALLVQITVGEKILFYFALSPYSHRLTVWPLVEKLVEKGNEVTFLSPFPPKPEQKNERVKEIVPSVLAELIGPGTGDSFLGDVLERRIGRSYEGLWAEHRAMGLRVCEALLQDRGGSDSDKDKEKEREDTREFLKNAQFDLVVIDALHNECGIGLAFKYQAPFILYGASSVFMWQGDVYGYFFESNWIPDITKNYDLSMGFLEKVRNTLNPIYVHLMRHWFEMPEMDKLLRDSLHLRYMPPLEELERNVSLILQNNHFSIEFPRALPPLYVSVAGMHCEDAQLGNDSVLPKELANFIEESDSEGFMLISFGTAINISLLPESFQNIFFEVLRNFSIRFVFKWDSERPQKMPENVFTAMWLPQQAILAHPKCKGFINQAGLLSIQEAITYGVPLIVLPVFGEQDYNAEKVQRQGYGIRLELSKLKPEGLSDAISNVLNEPKYKTKIDELSQLFKDRPMKALDSAVWWTEYVLRHKGGGGLQPLAASQSWFQRRLLDVWGFLLFLVFLIIFIIFLLIRQACIIILADEFEEDSKDENGNEKDGEGAGRDNMTGSRRHSEDMDEDEMDMDLFGLDGRRNSQGKSMYDDPLFDPDNSENNTPIHIPHILVLDDKKEYEDGICPCLKNKPPPETPVEPEVEKDKDI